MRAIILVVMLMVSSGCAAFQNLEELSTLREFAREKEGQEAQARSQDACFRRLLQQLATKDALTQYPSRTAIEKDFGAPIMCRGQGMGTKCMWRGITGSSESQKVYIHFDVQGKVVRWERL